MVCAFIWYVPESVPVIGTICCTFGLFWPICPSKCPYHRDHLLYIWGQISLFVPESVPSIGTFCCTFNSLHNYGYLVLRKYTFETVSFFQNFTDALKSPSSETSSSLYPRMFRLLSAMESPSPVPLSLLESEPFTKGFLRDSTSG